MSTTLSQQPRKSGTPVSDLRICQQHAHAGPRHTDYFRQLRIDALPPETAEELLQEAIGGNPVSFIACNSFGNILRTQRLPPQTPQTAKPVGRNRERRQLY